MTQQTLKFADDEPRDDHGRWTDGGGSSESAPKPDRARVRRALKTHKPATANLQRWADANVDRLAKRLRGDVTGDNDPFDILVKAGAKPHAIEVKTFLDNTNDKITMHPGSRARKEAWARRNRAIAHTVLLDDRDRFGTGGHSGNRLYYKRGVGSFRLGSMTPVRNATELAKLMGIRKDYAAEVRYDDSEPRDDHGRWSDGGSDSGGEAPRGSSYTEQLYKHGFQVAGMEHLAAARDVIDWEQASFPDNAAGRGAAAGAVSGLLDIQRRDPEFSRYVKNNITFVTGAPPPDSSSWDAAGATITGRTDTGKSLRVVALNANSNLTHMLESGPSHSIVNKFVAQAGRSETNFFRAVMTHELGHVKDYQMRELGSDTLRMTLLDKFGHDDAGAMKAMKYIERNVSHYAASSPKEAFAELYAAASLGMKVPKMFDWIHDVAKPPKRKAEMPEVSPKWKEWFAAPSNDWHQIGEKES